MKNLASLALMALLAANGAAADEPAANLTLALNAHSAATYTVTAEKPAAVSGAELKVNEKLEAMTAQLSKELEEKINRELDYVNK